jgi:hypothetical protein
MKKNKLEPSKRDKETVITVYTCGVDWQHEIGNTLDGNMIYGDIKDLKERNKCWKKCGIVELKVIFSQWMEPQDFTFGLKKGKKRAKKTNKK